MQTFMIPSRFNVRVYALASYQGKILVLHEPFAGQLINKFPGGGLEFGEGTIACLQREFKEELNLELEEIKHFYTQEDFVETPIRPDAQLLLIYYTARIKDTTQLQILDDSIQDLYWLTLAELAQTDFQLPTDKVVIARFLEGF